VPKKTGLVAEISKRECKNPLQVTLVIFCILKLESYLTFWKNAGGTEESIGVPLELPIYRDTARPYHHFEPCSLE